MVHHALSIIKQASIFDKQLIISSRVCLHNVFPTWCLGQNVENDCVSFSFMSFRMHFSNLFYFDSAVLLLLELQAAIDIFIGY